MVELERVRVDTATSGSLGCLVGGEGVKVVVFHRSIGGDPLAEFLSVLSERFAVVAPSLPGFDDSDRPDWARSPRDLAAVLGPVVGSLSGDRPVVVGMGLGGWVAAELATMCPDRLRGLVLVAPLGVQPQVGEITDPFLVSTERYVEMGFARAEDYRRTVGEYELGTELWLRRERNREMTTRIAWRPRMFDQTLPYRLPCVTTPTLVVWGERDAILPRGGVERYRDSIPGAELVTLADCGHMVECEAPDVLCDVVSSFMAKLE